MSSLLKKSNPAATAVNNAGKGHGEVTGDDFLLENPEGNTKYGREIMHDDKGAETGLRGRPDYGESDSYTAEMNEENSKAASANDEAEEFWSHPNEFSMPAKEIIAEYHIVVKTPKVASDGEMYISSVEFDPKDATQVEKFSFIADRTKAVAFHRLTADEIVHQLGGPDFGVWVKTVLAADFSEMFRALETIEPKARPLYRQEIEWAKKHLKKLDRIIWYLRWYRIALTEDLIKTLPAAAKAKQPVASEAIKVADTPPLQPQQQQPPPQVQQPQRAPKPKPKKKQLQELLAQYKKDFAAKGGDADQHMYLTTFPEIKRNLEHFYSLPVPDIQNKVLSVEAYRDIYNVFSAAEQEWKEQAKTLIKPKPEDKIFKQFSDGWAWWWLPRPYCEDESRAMGHCGNSPMKDRADVSILSLREPKQVGNETFWYPHCTFILHGQGDSGSIGEMKGRNNDKPVARYHPYIIELLKDPRITAVIGGGYLPEHNFSLADLTPEQRKEIATANPSIGLTVQDYYDEHGMDERLAARLITMLEFDEKVRWERGYGFVIHEWENTDALVEDVGDRNVQDALKFIKSGVYEGLSEPTWDEMADLMDELHGQTVYHIGLAFQYHYAPEIEQWYDSFDPHDINNIKELMKDIYTLKIKAPAEKPQDKSEEEQRAERLGLAKPEPETNPYDIPVIVNFWHAYQEGGPDRDMTEEMIQEKVHAALYGSDLEDTTIEVTKGAILQVVPEETVLEKGKEVEKGKESYGRQTRFVSPSIYLPHDWDDWSEERAVDALQDSFSRPPSRPVIRQEKLPYKGKGLTVSKLLKNSLFAAKKK